jgi:class 3 adenylate cyclase/GTPase SAR1 family protein
MFEKLKTLFRTKTIDKDAVELDLSSSKLKEIPVEVFQLQNLQRLDLHSNQLTELPKEIGQLQNLQELILSYNQLTELPKEIAQLQNLRELYLFNNQLTTLPKEIGHLQNLQGLDLYNNQLTTLPKEIAQLQNLKVLYLYNNQLTELSKEIAQLQHLSILSVDNNSLTVPPQAIADQGIKAIRQYFADLEKEGETFVYEAKLMLVGEPGAGKTSLREKLLNPKYRLQQTETMTRGIEVKHWQFPYSNAQTFTANIWDFGGQAIMHATHRYFLTQRSLYVLVVDDRKEHTDYFYWLNIIQLFGGNSPVLIVQNDVHGIKRFVPTDILKHFPNVSQQVFTVDLKNNDGLAGLRDAIQKRLKELPHVGKEPIPRNWERVREKIEKVKKSSAKDCISFQEYWNLCEQCGITDERQARIVSDFLHSLGTFLHFQDTLDLDDTIILNMPWATEAVYLVLLDKEITGKYGEFENTDLRRIWTEPKFPKASHAKLLRLMMKFYLCYKLDGEEKYVAPQLLQENPPSDYIWDENENLHFEFSYPKFMPKGIISQLIVRMHNAIWKKWEWRSGVVLNIEGGIAEVKEEFYNRKIRIRVRGNENKKCLTILQHELGKIHHTFEKLEIEEMFPCSCKDCQSSSELYFYSLNVLKEYEKEGIEKIRCGKFVRNEVNVQDVFNAVLLQHSEVKLLAVMFTDISGFTKRTQENQERTLTLVDEHNMVVRECLREYNGKEIKTIGDSFLVTFESAQSSLKCAQEIQRRFRARNTNQPEKRKIELHIGIHIGDVIMVPNDVFGNVVNAASRVLHEATEGEILVSKQLYENIQQKDVREQLQFFKTASPKGIEEGMELFKATY